MAIKERFQNPVSGDTVTLRLFSYNSNNFADIEIIEKVEIYYLDPEERTEVNPDGRRLVETFDGDIISSSETGHYTFELELETEKYVIGRYIDVWTIYPIADQPVQTVQNFFDVYPQLWYTTPAPVIYDFSFHFQPNRLRLGSKQYLIIEVTPNVPQASDLCRYYENLVIGANVSIYIEACANCNDDDLIVDGELIVLREKKFGYYHLDTEELECGLFNVWFKLEFANNVYISDKQQLEIY